MAVYLLKILKGGNQLVKFKGLATALKLEQKLLLNQMVKYLKH